MQNLFQNKGDRKKKLSLKLDNLWKHDNRKKTLITILNVYKVGEFYMNKSFGHAKNEHFYANVKKDIIINLIFHGVVIKMKGEKAQLVFVSINIYGQTFDGL
jgi:hypothetical protein